MRIRLMHLYKADKNYAEAAKRCLLLAALCRLEENEDRRPAVYRRSQADGPGHGRMRPGSWRVRPPERNFAESIADGSSADVPLSRDGEVDLSSDLMDIFFAGDRNSEVDEDLRAIPDAAAEETIEAFPERIQPSPARSFQEQLQEVDFYIRLGFHDEALAKLNEIAKLNPDNPELPSRYQKLGHSVPEPVSGTTRVPEAAAAYGFETSANSHSPGDADLNREWNADDAPGGFAVLEMVQAQPEPHQEPLPEASFPSADAFGAWRSEGPQISKVAPVESDASGFQANEMFADLMDGVGGASDEDVSVDSFENHFSLGTAYREMELVDEAVKEFESALKAARAQKDAKKTIQCCGMLSTCFLIKGMARSALRWCQTGLNMADNSSHEAMALRYDMGVAHSMSGSNERALECFDRIFSVDPGYRDVAQKIDEIKSGTNKHAP